MRHIAFIFMLLCQMVQAQDVDDLRLIQVHADLPTLHAWVNLPPDTSIERNQFSVSVGSHAATVFGIDPYLKTDEGVGYVFLVDISRSLKSRQLVQIKRSLARWLDGMGEQDQAALITFGHEVTHSQDFTKDRFRLGNAINLLVATDMETSLYHGLLEAISVGRSQDVGLPTRRAIVLLSDGIDDSLQGVTLDEVLRQNTEYRVPIYSIGFAAEPLNDRKREGLRVLGLLSRQSGGYFMPADPEELDSAYEQQHRLITQAYRLRLDCPTCEADGQLHHINLTWSDGARTLSDGLDIRLLPKPISTPALTPKTAKESNWSLPIFAIGVLAFLLGMTLVYRQRLAQPKEPYLDDLIPKPEPTQTKPLVNGLDVQLTVVAGVQKGKKYPLKIALRATLGRALNCDLVLDDDVEISSQHALLQHSNGQLTVRDLHSTNGTLVNGVPINNDYPLRNGDLLLLGRTELRIEFGSH